MLGEDLFLLPVEEHAAEYALLADAVYLAIV